MEPVEPVRKTVTCCSNFLSQVQQRRRLSWGCARTHTHAVCTATQQCGEGEKGLDRESDDHDDDDDDDDNDDDDDDDEDDDDDR